MGPTAGALCRGWCKYPPMCETKHRVYWRSVCKDGAPGMAMGMVQQLPNADQADE